MDALILPQVVGSAAAVRSTSPLGETVTLRVSADRVETDPAAAVISFGLARDDRGVVQQTVCPYINAFGSPAEYERWAAATPEAITMALSPDDAFALVRAMTAIAPDLTARRADEVR